MAPRQLDEDSTPRKKHQFNEIRKLNDQVRREKRAAQEEIRFLVKQKVDAIIRKRDEAITEAFAEYKKNPDGDGGLSIQSIKRAMETKDYGTVKRILDTMEWATVEVKDDGPQFTDLDRMSDRDGPLYQVHWLDTAEGERVYSDRLVVGFGGTPPVGGWDMRAFKGDAINDAIDKDFGLYPVLNEAFQAWVKK